MSSGIKCIICFFFLSLSLFAQGHCRSRQQQKLSLLTPSDARYTPVSQCVTMLINENVAAFSSLSIIQPLFSSHLLVHACDSSSTDALFVSNSETFTFHLSGVKEMVVRTMAGTLTMQHHDYDVFLETRESRGEEKKRRKRPFRRSRDQNPVSCFRLYRLSGFEWDRREHLISESEGRTLLPRRNNNYHDCFLSSSMVGGMESHCSRKAGDREREQGGVLSGPTPKSQYVETFERPLSMVPSILQHFECTGKDRWVLLETKATVHWTR